MGRSLLRAVGPRLEKSRQFRRNLRLAFPDRTPTEIEGLVREAWGNTGAVLAEYPHLETICRREADSRLEIVVKGDPQVLHEGGRPGIFVAAHLANWEISTAASGPLGIPLTVLYTPLQNPWMDRMLLRKREQLGCRLLKRDESMRPMIRELTQGRSIGLLVDQRVDSGEPLPFFGIEKWTTVVPARLALRFECELIPVRVERLAGARFRVTLYEPVRPDDGVVDEREQVLQMTRRVNALFETWIRERPHEWLCSKRRWPKQATPVSRA
jgi:KDO2-lipid IV(A) lauroyltransferase